MNENIVFELPDIQFQVYRCISEFDGVYTDDNISHSYLMGKFSNIDDAITRITQEVGLVSFPSFAEAVKNYEQVLKDRNENLASSDFEIFYSYTDPNQSLDRQLEKIGVKPYDYYGVSDKYNLHSKDGFAEPYSGLFVGLRGILTKQEYQFPEVLLFAHGQIQNEELLRDDRDPRVAEAIDKIQEKLIEKESSLDKINKYKEDISFIDKSVNKVVDTTKDIYPEI